MLYITTKLRRYRYIGTALIVLLLPITVLLAILYYIGVGAEIIAGWMASVADRFLAFLARRFNWNEVAREQHKTNPGKFK